MKLFTRMPILALVMVIAVSGCGSSDPLVGSWELASGNNGAPLFIGDDGKFSGIGIEFNKDGTACYILEGLGMVVVAEPSLTWQVDADHFVVEHADGTGPVNLEAIGATLDGTFLIKDKTLTFTLANGSVLTFARS